MVAATVSLVLEKVFVGTAGVGLGVLLFGLNWRTLPFGRTPEDYPLGSGADYSFRHAKGNIRLGLRLLAIGGVGAGLAYLASHTF
jgi:hypothetical protein